MILNFSKDARKIARELAGKVLAVQTKKGISAGIIVETEAYLGKIMNRLVFSGALFLGLIAVLPFILQAVTGTQALAIGGTSLLIVVSVAIDIAKQIEAQVTLHEYGKA